MGLLENTLIILLLIAISAFCSTSEIALAAARKLKLAQLAAGGDDGAARASHLMVSKGRRSSPRRVVRYRAQVTMNVTQRGR